MMTRMKMKNDLFLLQVFYIIMYVCILYMEIKPKLWPTIKFVLSTSNKAYNKKRISLKILL